MSLFGKILSKLGINPEHTDTTPPSNAGSALGRAAGEGVPASNPAASTTGAPTTPIPCKTQPQ